MNDQIIPRFSTAAFSWLLLFCLFCGDAAAAERMGEKRFFDSMHARIEILIPKESGSDKTPEHLADLAETAIRKADALFSPFGENSDVRRLNSVGANQWVTVDPLTIILVQEALKWHKLTGGRFDPTIGPLKKLFAFTRKEVSDWPSKEKIAETLKKVGADKLKVDAEGKRLAWAEDGMSLDLGAIAKGFAADIAAEILQAQGVQHALINTGGEMRVMGRNPGPPPAPWKVALIDPRGGSGDYMAEIENRGIATSGNYESYFEYKGERYSHILDPLIGSPLPNRVAGVTVSHPRHATVAEALSTTLSILGPVEGERFLREHAKTEFAEGLDVVMFVVGENRKLEVLSMRVDTSGNVVVGRP